MAFAKGDDAGRFQLTGLIPGEYRVIALRSVAPEQDEAVERAFTSGRKVEVGLKGLETVTLELTEIE